MSGPLVVVMGVSGAGKSTFGIALAARLGVPYVDGDDLHPLANVAKMSAGIPLDDEDRRPWLNAVGAWLVDHEATGGVAACSALRRGYRDRLRHLAPGLDLVHLTGSRDLLAERSSGRSGHFMPASLLGSQLATLEPLEPDERGLVLDVANPVDVLVEEYVERRSR